MAPFRQKEGFFSISRLLFSQKMSVFRRERNQTLSLETLREIWRNFPTSLTKKHIVYEKPKKVNKSVMKNSLYI